MALVTTFCVTQLRGKKLPRRFKILLKYYTEKTFIITRVCTKPSHQIENHIKS